MAKITCACGQLTITGPGQKCLSCGGGFQTLPTPIDEAALEKAAEKAFREGWSFNVEEARIHVATYLAITAPPPRAMLAAAPTPPALPGANQTQRESANGIGLRIASKYVVGHPGLRLAKEIADAIAAERSALSTPKPNGGA